MFTFNLISPLYIVVIILIILIYLSIRYFDNTKNQERYIQLLLLFLRYASIFLIFIILINPIMLLNRENIKNKKIIFFIDNSKSVFHTLSNYDLIQTIRNSTIWLENNTIDSELYIFGDSIRSIKNISEINFNDKSTNFNDIPKKINSVYADEYILISDGLQNQGMINFPKFKNIAINTFGIGSESNKIEDLSIKSIQLSEISTDSITINCSITANINKNYESIQINLSNDKVSNKNISTLNMEKNITSYFLDINIPKNIISSNNIISLPQINNEYNIDNNYYNLNISNKDLNKYKVLLLSGRISQNTQYIKSLFTKYLNVDLIHIYDFRFNNKYSDIFNKEYDAIIFDSFPTSHRDLLQFNNIKTKNKNLVFFLGPSMNQDYNYYNKFLEDKGYSLNENINYKTKINFIYNDSLIYIREFINQIVPIESDIYVKNNFYKSTFTDINDNTIVDYRDDNLFIFIPNLTQISNKTLNIYKNDNLSFLINYFLEKIIFQEDKLYLYLGSSDIKPDKIFYLHLNLNNMEVINNKMNLYIYDNNSNLILTLDKYEIKNNEAIFPLKLDKTGTYLINAKLELENKVILESNKIKVEIDALNIEMQNIFLNKANLQDISMKSRGKFHYIDELSEYVKSIKPHHVISRTIDRLKIFNFQAFWFLVLVLLAIEWIIRKNKGLL